MNDEELIKAVATEVMGWKWHDLYKRFIVEKTPNNIWLKIDKIPNPGQGKDYLTFIDQEWLPLTDFNHAFMVVERVIELGWDCHIEFRDKFVTIFKNADCGICRQYHGEAFWKDNNIGHAICEAAIAAIRSK